MLPLAVLVWVVGAVVAQEANPSLEPLVGYILNFGILGVFTVLWLLGKIKTAGDVTKAEARADKAEQAKADLEESLRTDVVPAMTRFTDVASRILDREIRP